MAEKVSRDEVIAFRLDAHNLTERRGENSFLDAAGACGIQNSPPGSALLAMHARVENVTQQRMDEASAEQQTLLQTWCMRGAPFCFPTADAPVFTTGALPPTETGRRHLILGVEPALDRLDLSLADAVEAIGAEIRGVLSGRRLAINELGAELAQRIASNLPAKKRKAWEEEGPYAKNQPLGEGVVHFCLRILTLQGIICFAPRDGNKAPFVLVDEWLGDSLPDIDPESARAELLRRYLHCYGPSTSANFAAWLGVRPADAAPWWNLLDEDLTEIDFNGRTWLLAEDLDTLRSSPTPEGVRLLPPRDPYTQLRDRETIVAKSRHQQIWKTIGEPGTVLADGELIGSWRPRKSGRKLTITVTTFDPLPDRRGKQIQDEAAQLAPLRNASATTVEFS